jgi:hypothetical protein
MKKSLLSKQLDPSKGLDKFFGDPPLFGSERLEDYKVFCSIIEAAAKPADDIARLIVRELVDTWWEIRRERQIKFYIIMSKQRQHAAGTLGLSRADYLRESMLARDENVEPSAFRKKESAPIEKKQEEDPISSLARVYLQSGGEIDFIDRRISTLEYRRSCLLREVDRRNQSVARIEDKACSDFVDAEFTETSE